MATKRWLGNAVAIADIWTISLSGTVISQTYSMTVNGKSVSYSASGIDTVATICTALAAAWNASSIPEFAEATASDNTTNVTITGDKVGNPVTISVSTSGGATFSIAHTTSATGPNDFANAANWSTASAPANSDVLVFDNGSVDCKYNLSTALTGVTVNVYPGYTGKIGLAATNTNNQASYFEYRTHYLTLAGGTLSFNGPSVQLAKFAFGANTTTITVAATGSRLDKYTPPLLITGGDSSSTIAITKGDVGVANYQTDTAQFNVISTSYTGQAATDVTLYCGSGATLTTVSKNGGVVTVNTSVTTLTQGTAGGTLVVAGGAITTLTSDNGTVIYNSTGALGTATIAGNTTLSFDLDPRAKTVANPIVAYGSQATVIDNQKVVNSGVLSVTTTKTASINIQHGDGSAIVLA